jgi:hypothetical protein
MNIPTAEQFLENYRFKAGEHIGNSDYDLMAKYAIEFAKLHLEAAVGTISKKVKLLDDKECWNNGNCSCEHPCINSR